MAGRSRARQLIDGIAGSAAFGAVAPKIFPPADRFLHRVTGGRVLLSKLMMPSLVLTTIGHKSGEPRAVPLATVPDGDTFLVVGSNFGRPQHPAWTNNLLQHPEASVDYGRRTFPVVGTMLTDEEKADVWPRLTARWPSYDRYEARSHRNIRVFRLTPVSSSGS